MAKKKKKMRPAFRRLLMLGGILFFVGLVISAMDWNLQRAVKGININIIKVNGQEFINKEDVLRIIEEDAKQDLSGVSVGKLDVPRIERALKESPFVLKGDAYLDASNKLYIEITQRNPIIRVIDAKGRQYYLSENGVRMPLSKHGITRLPVASGNIPPYYEGYLENENSMLHHLFDLINFLREDEFLINLTEQIYIDEKDEFSLVPKIGQHQIILGKVTDLEEKFEKLKIFYKEALPYKGWQKYKIINLKYKDQVVSTKG